MLAMTSLTEYLNSHPQAAGDLHRSDRLPTIVIEWDQAPELLWTLRMTEYCGDRERSWGYQPQVSWHMTGDGGLFYIDRPATQKAEIPGRLSARVWPAGDGTCAFEISMANPSATTITDGWGWLCLIHRWARAFQANCELPAGSSENAGGPDAPWVNISTLRAPLERWLKWSPVQSRLAEATRIGQHQGARWQPHIQAQAGAVRAWRAEGTQRQFMELASPDAIILGWSHWPCTDMGVYFGTLGPGEVGKVTGVVRFRTETYVPI
ncbi:MAG: hypothetical protein HY326_07310 [Chloroflexi bacterium]|nr:hypothetical protein [Chloroflexota bacterium]